MSHNHHLLIFITAMFCLYSLASAAIRPAFSFVYDGKEYRDIPQDWKVAQTQNGTQTLTTATAPDGLEMTLEATAYTDFPVTEWTLSFANKNTVSSKRFTRISSGDFSLPFTNISTPTLWHGIGEGSNPNDNYSFTETPLTAGKPQVYQPAEGYPSYRAFPYFRVYDGQRGYTVAIGWQGQWQAVFERQAEQIHVRAGQQTVDFELLPGEAIITPRVTVLEFSSRDDAVNIWRRWFNKYILQKEKDGQTRMRPRLVMDGHERGELYTMITADSQLALMNRLWERGIQFDAWWIDAGWYVRELRKNPPVGNWFYAGDWSPDPKRFPHGLKPMSDALAAHKAELTLWYEPERVHQDSRFIAQAKPYLAPPNVIFSYRYDLSQPQAVDFLTNIIGKSIVDNGVSIYRQDSNGAGPLMFWQASEAKRHDGRHGMVENQAIQGLFRFWQGLRKQQPGLLIDTCASGGRRNDLETLRQGAVPLHYTDIGYTDFVPKQRFHHMLNQWFLYHKNIAQHCYEPAGTLNQWRAVIDLAAFHALYAKALLADDISREQKWIEVWKQTATLLLDADYYLLTPEIFQDDQWWITQFNNPETRRGFLQVARNAKNQQNDYSVSLRGLPAGVTCRFTDLYSGKSFTQLSTEPLKLTLQPQDATVLIYELQ